MKNLESHIESVFNYSIKHELALRLLYSTIIEEHDNNSLELTYADHCMHVYHHQKEMISYLENVVIPKMLLRFQNVSMN
jgi:hypothetical protein